MKRRGQSSAPGLRGARPCAPFRSPRCSIGPPSVGPPGLVAVLEEFLRVAQDEEGVAQALALEFRQFLRVDAVVRLLACGERLRLVAGAHHGDELERVVQILPAAQRQDGGVDDVLQALEGVDRRRTDRQRMHTDQVGQRRGAAALDVDDARVAAVGLDHEILEKTQRRRSQQRVARHAGEEARVALRLARNEFAQLRRPLHPPPHAIEVEEDAGVEERLWRRPLDPVGKRALPHAQGLAPFLVGRHHAATAIAVAAARQPVADEGGERLEIDVVTDGVETVVEHQRVVLVGDDELLLPRHRPERKEAVRHRRRTELGLGQLQQALLEAAPDRGHCAAHHVRAGILTQHSHEAGAHVRHQRGEFVHRLRTEDAPDHEQAVARLIANDVRQGDDAERTLVLHHRQVMHVVPQHRQHGFEHQLVVGHSDHVCGHDVGHWNVVSKAWRKQTGAQVAVGEDARQQGQLGHVRVVVDDQQRGHPFLGHSLRRFARAGTAPQRDGRPADQGVDRGRHQVIGVLAPRHDLAQPRAVLDLDLVGKGLVVLEQLEKHRLRNQVQQRIFQRLHRETHASVYSVPLRRKTSTAPLRTTCQYSAGWPNSTICSPAL